jgi:hypothetical protein
MGNTASVCELGLPTCHATPRASVPLVRTLRLYGTENVGALQVGMIVTETKVWRK